MHVCMNFSPVPSDGTSVYRSWGVLPKMRKKADMMFTRAEGNLDWTHVASVDSIFLQRAFTPQQVQLGGLARDLGKPIMADYDDDLFCVPTDNPTHATYGAQWVHQNIENVCRMASAVTVSTEALKDRLVRFNPNVRVVPNALDLDILHPMPQDMPRNKTVVWRGSHTHVRDLMQHTPAIMDAYEKFPEWNFFFVGYNPWWITERMRPERCSTIPFDGSYVNYMRNLSKIRGAIQIVPLADNEFNRAKSNISYLEASFAGSVALIPDWEEWRLPHTMRYNGADQFHSMLLEMMSGSMDSLSQSANESWAWVRAYRSLDLMNDLRLDVFRKFLGL